jgi:hypothetical protein
MVAAKMKEVVDPVVGGKEALRLAGRLQPLYPSFSSSCRLMRVLSTVVQPLVLAVLDGRNHLLLRGAVACQLASFSLVMTRGGRICRFSSFLSSRLAACLSRRLCTSTSRTIQA